MANSAMSEIRFLQDRIDRIRQRERQGDLTWGQREELNRCHQRLHELQQIRHEYDYQRDEQFLRNAHLNQAYADQMNAMKQQMLMNDLPKNKPTKAPESTSQTNKKLLLLGV